MFYRTNNEGTKCHHNKTKLINIEDVNDDELVLSSSGVVLEINQRGEKLLQNYEGYSGIIVYHNNVSIIKLMFLINEIYCNNLQILYFIMTIILNLTDEYYNF
jgi:hypothetical protein